MTIKLIEPDWFTPKNVQAFSTTRLGGYSSEPYSGLNLGLHVGDSAHSVDLNRSALFIAASMPAAPAWLNQVHGNHVEVIHASDGEVIDADASVTQRQNLPLVIMTADCLPIVMTNTKGSIVAAIHCGWRSLAGNIIEHTMTKMLEKPENIIVWLGPCISQDAFEVGDDVYNNFMELSPEHITAFKKNEMAEGKYFCNLQEIALQKLKSKGITQVSSYSGCTYKDSSNFYSYRRDGQTGRMATFIWIS